MAEEHDDVAVQLGFVIEEDEDGGPPPEFPPLHDEPDWTLWDGGKVGGRPSWLDPEHLPGSDAISCSRCKEPMAFLLQIYAPLSTESAVHAFHRSIYLFCCKNGPCCASGGLNGGFNAETGGSGSVMALRCILPKENAYHRSDSKKSREEPAKKSPMCEVCGRLATFKCSRCKAVSYCCRAHQVEHWKFGGHKKTCGKQSAVSGGFLASKRKALPSTFREWDMVIEEEPEEEEVNPKPLPEKQARGGLEAGAVDDAMKRMREEMKKNGEIDEEEEEFKEGYNTGFKAGDWVDMAGDEQAKAFLQRIRRAPEQCLRYAPGWEAAPAVAAAVASAEAGSARSAGGVFEPFWAHSKVQCQPCPVVEDGTGTGTSTGADNNTAAEAEVGSAAQVQTEEPPKAVIPPCSHCGSPRKFEFQVMPQLLHFVGIEQDNKNSNSNRNQHSSSRSDISRKALDFGTMVVYSCPISCAPSDEYISEHGAYVQEAVWVQPAIGFDYKPREDTEDGDDGDDDDDDDDDDEEEGAS